MWQIYLNYHQRMGILPLKKRVNRDNYIFATKQRMFGVSAIDEILRYRWTPFGGLRTLCHPAWCNCWPYAANASVWLTDFQPWRSWYLGCIMLQNMQRQASPPLFETWEVLILAGAKTATSQGKNTAKLTIMNSPSRSFSCIPTSGWKAVHPRGHYVLLFLSSDASHIGIIFASFLSSMSCY